MMLRNSQSKRIVLVTLVMTAAGGGACGGPKNVHVDSLVGSNDHIVRKADVCTIYYGDDCPPDASCNPPPPEQVACPAELPQDGELRQDHQGACVAKLQECVAGPMPTCNPPAPQQVPCVEAEIESGMMRRDGSGICYEDIKNFSAGCPEPEWTCTPLPDKTVACPPPRAP